MSAIAYVPDYIHHPDPAHIGVSGEHQTGDGSPVGVVTPHYIGDFYIDLLTGTLYVADGLTSADWTAWSGGGGMAGAGPPTVTYPTGPTNGQEGTPYVDTLTGMIYWWYSGVWNP